MEQCRHTSGASVNGRGREWTHGFIEVLLRAVGKEAARAFDFGLIPLANVYPAIAAWRERIRALPGHDATWPPHGREAD